MDTGRCNCPLSRDQRQGDYGSSGSWAIPPPPLRVLWTVCWLVSYDSGFLSTWTNVWCMGSSLLLLWMPWDSWWREWQLQAWRVSEKGGGDSGPQVASLRHQHFGEKVHTIEDWPTPTDQVQLKCFLVLAAYEGLLLHRCSSGYLPFSWEDGSIIVGTFIVCTAKS